MIVKITHDLSKHGIAYPLLGEFYKAKPYWLDSDKITLIYQVDPITFEKHEKQHSPCSDLQPLSNEYLENVTIIQN